jgi:hypothetical protein
VKKSKTKNDNYESSSTLQKKTSCQNQKLEKHLATNASTLGKRKGSNVKSGKMNTEKDNRQLVVEKERLVPQSMDQFTYNLPGVTPSSKQSC